MTCTQPCAVCVSCSWPCADVGSGAGPACIGHRKHTFLLQTHTTTRCICLLSGLACRSALLSDRSLHGIAAAVWRCLSGRLKLNSVNTLTRGQLLAQTLKMCSAALAVRLKVGSSLCMLCVLILLGVMLLHGSTSTPINCVFVPCPWCA